MVCGCHSQPDLNATIIFFKDIWKQLQKSIARYERNNDYATVVEGHVVARGWHQCGFNLFSALSFMIGLITEPWSSVWAWQAGQGAPITHLSLFHSTGVTGVRCHIWLFDMGAGIRIQFLKSCSSFIPRDTSLVLAGLELTLAQLIVSA